MVLRPLELIVNDIIQEIQAVLPNASTLPGSVIREAFVNPPAAQISQLYNALDAVQQAQTIAEATGTSLDRLASNFGLTRDPGRSAVGELTLVLTDSVASVDITVNDGVTVTTDERTGTIEFAIIGTHVFRPIDKDFFAAEAVRLKDALQLGNITNANYVVTVPIQALRAGSIGNVGSYAVIRGNVPGVRAVVNLSPTVGGADVESDASLRRRISLILSGTSSGTVEGLMSIALANPAVTDATVIRPGDPLMTRDGSEFDSQGNLIKAGTGRSVDLYVKGNLPTTNTETFGFTDHGGASVTTENNLVLGYDAVSDTNIFAKQPVEEILDLVGSISGANFKKGQEVTDSEGNVILTGNYVLLSDIQQEIGDAPIMIVRDNTTGETKVATFLSPVSNRYSLIEKVATSGRGNSALGLDSVFWLTNVATVNEETLSRGNEFNGSDTLAHSNVAQLQSVNEDVILTKESIIITSQGISQNVFVIYTKHAPVVSIAQVRHTRLGFNYDFQLLDGDQGKIQLIGRFVPQAGDIIQVSYTWRESHAQNIEYFLQGNTVKWARDPFERPTTRGLSLLDPTTLQDTLTLEIQPLIPTYLGLQANQLTARAQYNMTISGNKARIVTGQKVTYQPNPIYGNDFWFTTQIPQSATSSESRLGRVVSVKNLTKGFTYSIENMALNTNVFDPTVRVVESSNAGTLISAVGATDTILMVSQPILFIKKDIVKIDNELMQVQSVLNNEVLVTRGFNDTFVTAHSTSAAVFILLRDNEFVLDGTLNTRHIEIGDKVLLSRKSLMRHWTTTNDFTGNILGNPAPTYDTITTSFANDEITVRRQEDDTTSPATILSGSITQSGTLSGIVEITDDVIIEPGISIILSANTVIRFRDSKSLNSIQTIKETVELKNSISTNDIENTTNIIENVYIFERPTGSTAPFFIILNNTGTETTSIFYDRDVVKQVLIANLPIISLTRVGSTATVVCTNHGFTTGDWIKINGANEVAYNGTFEITVIDANHFSYTVVGAPTTPATGTITAVKYDYYINGKLTSQSFVGSPVGSGLLAAILTAGTFLGYRRNNGDDTTTFVSHLVIVGGRSQYGIPLSNRPKITGVTVDDFSFFQASNPDAVFTDTAYDQDRNIFLVGSLAVEADYIVEYFIEIVRRLSLRVRGTLQVSPDVTEGTPIVFTSTAAAPAPGDWEGIIFEPTSHTNAIGNPFGTSYLINTTIKYARIGIQNNTSDPFLDRCIIKKCLDGAYSVISNHFLVSGYTNVNFRLLSNDFSVSGRSYIETRHDVDGYSYGYGPTTSTRTLSLKFADLFTTVNGQMPPFEKIGFHELVANEILDIGGFASKYMVNFNYGTDYKVFIDNVLITPGVDADFAIEYDRKKGGFLLSFFNTQRTLNFMAATIGNPNVITVNYYAVYDNGSINNSIITSNGNSAFDIDKTAVVALRNNTIHANQFYGITVTDSYVFASNDLITGYDITAILQDDKSVVNITTSDMWSLPVINSEQNEIAEIDTLELGVSVSDTILNVSTPLLYKRNTIIKIDNEFMQVQDTLGDRVSVIRGYGNTIPAIHDAGATIFIQRTKTIFTVTGVPGNYCLIREVASDGTLLPNREPVTMLKIADNTFRSSFSVDRSSTFYYRFQFKNSLSDLWWILSETRKLIVPQFGNAVNNFINPDHEVSPFVGSFDLTNYSDNPLYKQPQYENFAMPDNSPASTNNPIYRTPYDPMEARLVFLGRSLVEQDVVLTAGTSTIVLTQVPIVTTSVQTDIVVELVSNPDRKLSASTYNPNTRSITLSAPVSSANVGVYRVRYSTPITLGTQISPFPLTTSIIYQHNEQRIVDFTKIVWRNVGDSGDVKMRFRVANSTSDLPNVPMSNFSDVSPFDLSFGTGLFPRGSVIEFEVVVATNDAGFTSSGVPTFPRLQDFSLFLTPARDNVLYNVLHLEYDTKTDKTIVTIEDGENQGLGIRNSTFTTVGTDDVLSIILRKAVDQFVESTEFVIGESDAIATGDTQIRIKHNVIQERTIPDPNDVVIADMIYVDLNDSEEVVFIENGTQVTGSRFYSIDSIKTQVVIDKVQSQLATETLSIVALDQPAPGTQYLVDYTFTAPLDGELITASYTYNNVVRTVAQPVESQKVLTSDVLVRAAVTVPIRIEANVFIATGFNATSIVVDVTSALNTFLASRASFGGTILVTDIETVMTNVTGVQSVKLNVLSRTPANEVVDMVLTAREYGVLASNNPILTIALASSPSQTLTTNSV